ncbi:translation initiation factor IF-2 [Ereboglobus luteus]|uniref:Translation initiation factor IF-2 n=1 Tax=Ereboglobus luteus TaxID=1796921 RepID=A0A2U8E3L6_9BACT|nr:translation initiation factor IF-2 [Ereboglobus luteus]AWI09479.1 translation initiation factor IF-2 [Ereboglobus luteus]
MSIRIHELAKKIGMNNKELLAMLKERKFDVKSVSSTIDNISAEAIVEEFAEKNKTAEAAAQPPPPAPEPEAAPAPVQIPTVKSAADVAREKEEAARAKKAAEDAARAASSPSPAAPVEKPAAPRKAAPAVPPPPPVVSAPKPPPAIPAPKPASPRPASIPAVRSAPAVPPSPPQTPGVRPAPSAAPAQSAPRPASPPPAAPVSRPVSAPPPPAPRPVSAPPPPPIASAPKPTPAIPGTTPPIAPASATPDQPSEAGDGELKIISLKPPVIVRDFAPALGLKPFKLISELMGMGVFASMNQAIDEGVAIKVAEKHGYLLEVKHRGDAASQQAAKAEEKKARAKKAAAEDDPKNLAPRPPVVCILGHVDHGKTSLLDSIRKAHVASGEAGGITQHIGAYQIEYNGRKITFLDTPGHAAFNKMRARGADATDIAILVIAADDGFKPQTEEALAHAQNAKVPIIVAVNKMDVKGANLDQVKAQMQQHGIAPEDWGGETITVPVSAIKGTGISDLMEMILLQSDVLELKANPKADPSGVIIESQIDVGRGPLATVIVQRGTLKVGDSIVCGQQWAKIRAMYDDRGNAIKEAPPSTPARVIGWSGAPDSGATFKAVKNAREAERLAEDAQHAAKLAATSQAAAPKETSIDALFANIAASQQKTLKIIIKADVYGSTEAVRSVLENIKSSKVALEIVSTDVGLISKNDVLMASTGSATIIGFNTKLENGVTPLAKHHKVRIETFGIIYELADRVREMMADLLEPDLKEVKLGAAEVRATFPLAKGFVAGCLVTEGKITRNAQSRLRRGNKIAYEGKIEMLKRFKDDANEVRAGLECGIKLGDYNAYEIGDVIECFEIQKVRASL